ncbi:MAG: hypothetical protein M3M88_01800 [Thermoproteota archaeon]|nr:hypothetical protein [Thermoproteota archaeon]
MTFPKGYVPPNKKAADEKAKQLADEKAKQLADEKAKQLADAKTVSKGNGAELSTTEDLYKRSSTQQNDIVDNNINYQNNDIDYSLIWDEMNKAYVQTVKEATNSYFRLLEFWMKNFKQ